MVDPRRNRSTTAAPLAIVIARSPKPQILPSAASNRLLGRKPIGFGTVQTEMSLTSTLRLCLNAVKPTNTATIATSSATAHRQRGDRSRPSGNVSSRWKIGKISRIHDQLRAQITSHIGAVTCCGGGIDPSQFVASVLAGRASPGIISSQPTMLRGWRDTISAPLTMKASRLPTRDTAATAWYGVAAAVCCAYDATRRPMTATPTTAITQTRRAAAGDVRPATTGVIPYLRAATGRGSRASSPRRRCPAGRSRRR